MRDLTLSVSRASFIITSDADRIKKLELAQNHYAHFDNVFTGPGVVDNCLTRALTPKQSIQELAENLLICGPVEMIDRLAPFAESGVDQVSLTVNFGASQQEVLESIQCIAEDVMPHFVDTTSNDS